MISPAPWHKALGKTSITRHGAVVHRDSVVVLNNVVGARGAISGIFTSKK
jgi:hypothetical protein